VNDVFHVSQLKKCLCVPEEQIHMEDRDVKEDLSYQKYPVKILETTERVTQNKRAKMCKVQWSHHIEEESPHDLHNDAMCTICVTHLPTLRLDWETLARLTSK
jgi:hypothetical protein